MKDFSADVSCENIEIIVEEISISIEEKVVDEISLNIEGAIGPQGPQGEDGEEGPQGPKGDDGEGVPEGGTTGQVLAKKSGTDFDTEWVNQSGGGGGGTWGSITGTLSDQTDLQNSLNNKQDSLGFTPENVANKAVDFSVVNDTLYPSVKAVNDTFAKVFTDLDDVPNSYTGQSDKFVQVKTDGTGLQFTDLPVADINSEGILVVGTQQLPGGKNFFKIYTDSDDFNSNLNAQTIINNTVSTDNAFNIAFYPQIVLIDGVDHNEVTVGGLLGVSNIGSGNVNNILGGIAFTVAHEGAGTVATMLGMIGAVNTTEGSTGNVDLAVGGNLGVEHEGLGTITDATSNASSITNFDAGIITTANAFIADIVNEGEGEIENGYVLKCARLQATNKFGVLIDVPESKNTLHQLTLKAALDIVPSPLVDDAVILVDAKLSNIFDITLTASNTLGNPTDAKDGQELIFRIRQDGTGGHSLTLDTKFRFGTTLPSITISSGANTLNYLTVMYNQVDDTFDVIDFKAGF